MGVDRTEDFLQPQRLLWASRSRTAFCMTEQSMSQSGKTGVHLGAVLWADVPCLDDRSLLLHLPKPGPRACRTAVSHWKAPKALDEMWLWLLAQTRG